MGSGRKTFKWIAVFVGCVLPFYATVNAADEVEVAENLRTGRSSIPRLGDGVSEVSFTTEQSEELGRVRVHDSGVNSVVPVSHSCACPPGRVRIHILDSNGCRDNRFDLNGNYTPYSFSTNSVGDAGANGLGASISGSGSANPGFFGGLGAAVSVARTAKHRSPNVKGDLLGASRAVSFFYHRVGDNFADVEAGGFIGFKNAKIAENNSPEPRDRVGFRYNYFHNAQDVGGYTLDQPITITQPDITSNGNTLTGFPDLIQYRTVQKSYDEHLFTWSVEQTFAEESFSMELRVPMRRGLGSDQELSSGTFVDAGTSLAITETPTQTLGEAATEIGNMNLITKAVFVDEPAFLLSGGFGLSIPTGEDATIRVTDFTGPTLPFSSGPSAPFPFTSGLPPISFVPGPADAVRVRTFEIDNDAWSVSPYLSFLAEPSDRFYIQGFSQFEIALNPNHYQFSNIHTDRASLSTFPLLPNRIADGSISEQSLLHLDLAVGYWFFRDPNARRLNGIAGQIELHYTTTLNDADIVTLPGEPDPGFIRQTASQDGFEPEPAPTIGNTANQLDILNLTVGTTLELFNHVTMATAAVVPLRDGHDKFFDWELNFQLNYYLDPIHPR